MPTDASRSVKRKSRGTLQFFGSHTQLFKHFWEAELSCHYLALVASDSILTLSRAAKVGALNALVDIGTDGIFGIGDEFEARLAETSHASFGDRETLGMLTTVDDLASRRPTAARSAQVTLLANTPRPARFHDATRVCWTHGRTAQVN